jgi:hypothetical protein
MNKILAGNHRVSLIRQQDQNKDQTITGSYFNCYFQSDAEAYSTSPAKLLSIIIMKLLEDERRSSVSYFLRITLMKPSMISDRHRNALVAQPGRALPW